MHRLGLATLLVLSVVASACSSAAADGGGTPPEDAAADASGANDGGSDDAASTETSTPADDAAPLGAPKAPTVTGAMPMGGALHVTWKLNDTGLTNVELWRKDGAGAYAKVYTLPGTATSQHDAAASVVGTTYCFQVKTLRGGLESPLSNEKCGTP